MPIRNYLLATAFALTSGAAMALELQSPAFKAPTFSDPAATRSNLGLGTAATQNATAFDAAGAAASEATRAQAAEATNATAAAAAQTKANAALPTASAAPSATTDTTNAANITSGTLPAARLPTAAITGGTVSGADVSGAVATATGGTASRTHADRSADMVSVKEKGAKGDGQLVNATVTIGSGSTSLTVGSSLFAASDVGKTIVVGNAGVAPTTGTPETVAVSAVGSGYTSVPTCALTDASSSGSGATCAALMQLVTATVVSGGTGCVNGSSVEFIVGVDGVGSGANAGSIPRFTGSVSGGVLSGSLTITYPGLQTTLGALSAASAYGDSCTTAPTIALSYGVGAVQMTAVGSAYSTTQTTAALTGGSPSVAATLGAVNVAPPAQPLITTIASYVSPTQVTLAASASTAVSGTAKLLWATDDHLAFQAAINAGKGVFIPAGIYWTGANSLDPGTGNLIVMGAGRDNTIVAFDNGNTTNQDSGTAGAWTPLFKHTGGTNNPPSNGELTFQDFQVRGIMDFGRYDIGAAAFELNNYKRISQNNMILRQMPWMVNQNQGDGQYIVTNSFFDTNMRDQARCRACFSVRIIGNKFVHSDDDSVAIHQVSAPIGPGQVGEDVIVENNDFEDTLCIHILGARNAIVRGNTGRRCKVQGVNLSWTQPPAGEGVVQLRSLIIADNIFTDTTTRNGSGAAVCGVCASVSGPAAPSGITSMLPGVPASVNFTPKPWDYDHNSIYTTTQFFPSARGVNIHDNMIMRTLPAQATYSAWGYGTMLTAKGFADVPMPDNMLQPTSGISTSVNVLDQRIHDNHVHDVRRGIVINDNVVATSQVNISVNTNDVFNAWEYGIVGFGSGQTNSLEIMGNHIAVDPYLISPGRSGANGGWTSNYSVSYGVFMNYVGPVRLISNTMSEMYQTQQPLGSWIVWENTIRGQPFGSTTGPLNSWSSANFGVGVYPTNGANMWDIQPVTSNVVTSPTSYGLRQFAKNQSSAAAPTSGWHTVGDFIASTAPGTCSCTGWIALTTGTAWVSGTDYKLVPIQ